MYMCLVKSHCFRDARPCDIKCWRPARRGGDAPRNPWCDYGKVQVVGGGGIAIGGTGRSAARRGVGGLDLQVGYRSIRCGRPVVRTAAGGRRRGGEERGAGDAHLGVEHAERGVGRLDAVRGASPCAGVGDVVDRARVRARADAVVGRLFSARGCEPRAREGGAELGAGGGGETVVSIPCGCGWAGWHASACVGRRTGSLQSGRRLRTRRRRCRRSRATSRGGRRGGHSRGRGGGR